MDLVKAEGQYAQGHKPLTDTEPLYWWI